ncbi:MAG: hypothetical protein A2W92_11455 [Bacteroidetes bacterium GWA2_42_15]|nr:MAG: hypothetical protein A2W92_11455 [Bacteroidetes bacterium GWA2_42_15]
MEKKCGMVIFFLLVLLQATAQDKIEFKLKKDSVETTGRIKLATDVYLPDENKTYPVILVRTPYQKENFQKNAIKFIKQGYAVVVQDCRGKFGSGGAFYAFKNEREDGLKTIDWIKKQPWHNGKVAGYGGSYVGYTQWAVSDRLDGVCAVMTSADIYDLIYPQGLFSLATAFNWGFEVDARTMNPISSGKILKSYWHLPLSTADDSTFKDNRFINDWLLHETRDIYWISFNHRGNAKGPVLSIAGWYDICLLSQINDFLSIDKRNGHPGSRLIIGPWCHGPQSYRNEYGGRDKTGNREALMERFLACNIKGEHEDVLQSPFTGHKYNFFIMERNEYFGSESWPPKEVEKVDYFLGENKILTKAPDKPVQLKFEYDPLDPYPSLGGTFLGRAVGPAIQNTNTVRKDQWVFESEVLDTPLTLLGIVSASLYVSSTMEQTVFMILVQDVFPNDTIINIQEGGKQVKIVNNKATKIELESWPTGYQLNPGHKLRIVITSGWFPRYNRNLNTGEPIFSAREIQTAIQTIYFGPEHPSKITLPLLYPKP